MRCGVILSVRPESDRLCQEVAAVYHQHWRWGQSSEIFRDPLRPGAMPGSTYPKLARNSLIALRQGRWKLCAGARDKVRRKKVQDASEDCGCTGCPVGR